MPPALQLSGFDEDELPPGNPGPQQQLTSASEVPAPATIALFCLGLAGLAWSRRKTV